MLKWIALTATAGGYLRASERLALALAERAEEAPVVWIAEGANHQNFSAWLGQRVPALAELVGEPTTLAHYDAWLPPAEGALEPLLPAAPILVVESLDPLLRGENPEWARLLAAARALVLLGTDACYGGLVWSQEEVERVMTICREADTPVVKLPGLPVPPHHLVGTLGHLAFVGFPEVDRYHRPRLYYGEILCTHCERRWALEAGEYAALPGEEGCLLEAGCKGPLTHNSCADQRWNGGVNWCVGAGAPCTGCSEPGYPRHGGLGLYGRPGAEGLGDHARGISWVRTAAWSFFGLAGLGVSLRLLIAWLDPGERDRPGARPRTRGGV